MLIRDWIEKEVQGRSMYSCISSAVLHGLKAELVKVEVDAGNGLPGFDMSGFLGSEVKEARERVRVAIRNSGFNLIPQRIVVNISPADIRKHGTGFDLPIALGILAANGYIDEVRLDRMLVLGELGLNGDINGVTGVLPCVLCARNEGFDKAVIPIDNENEGEIVDGIEVIAIANLKEAVRYINGEDVFSGNKNVTIKETYCTQDSEMLDFSDIRGGDAAKRATLIAVCGMHNIMYMGPPGSGKTMMARRIPTIMPEMTFDERLEVTNIYSVAGQLGSKRGLINKRPFRAPYCNVTKSAFLGGGMYPVPGEVTLAGKGVLFLDEMTEFRPDILEGLRQPLEDRRITIVRLNNSYVFPTDFMLVGAINPCRCGYYPDRNRCNCSEQDIERFLGRISNPLWDRFDMCVRTEQIKYSELQSESIDEKEKDNEYTSEKMSDIVRRVRKIQMDRFRGRKIMFNSQMNSRDVAGFCQLGKAESKLMGDIYSKKHLTARGYHKILKTARTIADIEGNKNISMSNISEAFYYRGIPDVKG